MRSWVRALGQSRLRTVLLSWLWQRLRTSRRLHQLLAVLGALALLLGMIYAALALAIAAELVETAGQPALATPAALGLRYEPLSFSSADGLPLHGWLARPPAALDRRQLLVLLHDVRSGPADPAMLQLAAQLCQAGFAVLTFDGRGYGRAASQPYMLGYAERHDLLGALAYARSRGYSPGAIGVLGLGSGGATALLAGLQRDSVGALVVDSSYASLPDQIRSELRRHHMPAALLWGIRWAVRLRYGPDIRYILPEAELAQQTDATHPLPLLVIHGAKDAQVAPDHARRLVEAAGAGITAELWMVPGMGHLEALERSQQLYIQRVSRFFEGALEKRDD